MKIISLTMKVFGFDLLTAVSSAALVFCFLTFDLRSRAQPVGAGAAQKAAPVNYKTITLTTLTNLAQSGDTIAQNELGMAYGLGKRVRKADPEEAFKWFRMAADKGYAPAQYNLGSLYYYGTGVPKDYQEALKWYRKAADQGFVQAQYFLGWMYSNGRGVDENFKESIRWFQKAAEQGDPEAQLSLGLMHARGEDLNPDYVEAYKWMNLAAAQGNTNAVKHRAKLSVSMTPEQLAEGQRRSVQFSEKPSGTPGPTNKSASLPQPRTGK